LLIYFIKSLDWLRCIYTRVNEDCDVDREEIEER
jgi:hypothetical protein